MSGQIILLITYAQTVKEKMTFKTALRRIMVDDADFTGLLNNDISS